MYAVQKADDGYTLTVAVPASATQNPLELIEHLAAFDADERIIGFQVDQTQWTVTLTSTATTLVAAMTEAAHAERDLTQVARELRSQLATAS